MVIQPGEYTKNPPNYYTLYTYIKEGVFKAYEYISIQNNTVWHVSFICIQNIGKNPHQTLLAVGRAEEERRRKPGALLPPLYFWVLLGGFTVKRFPWRKRGRKQELLGTAQKGPQVVNSGHHGILGSNCSVARKGHWCAKPGHDHWRKWKTFESGGPVLLTPCEWPKTELAVNYLNSGL